ncbi:MAG: DNA methyltransferase [Chloroflexus sp.]|nr:MAG: DNA methyltransferase [Chloroflexus sp.]
MRGKIRPPVYWYGGKFYLVSRLTEIIDTLPPHRTYVEVFGGAGTLLLNKPRSEIEVYNDLDEDLVNLYRVIRNHETFEQLRTMLELTPYSRKEQLEATLLLSSNEKERLSPVERAAIFFTAIRQSFSGSGVSRKPSWSVSVNLSRCGMSKTTACWLSSISQLYEIHMRLRTVQIECDDFRNIIKRFDTDRTLFYCDPPYVHGSRANSATSMYKHEMTDNDHGELVELLCGIRGYAIVSGYDSPIYKRLEGAGFSRIEVKIPLRAAKTQYRTSDTPDTELMQADRTEIIWVSPLKKRTWVYTQAELFQPPLSAPES